MRTSKIELNETGKLILPDDLEQFVQLIPHAEIKTTVNGKPIFKPVSVTKEDNVKITARIQDTDAEVIVDVSNDKLFAYLQLKPAQRVTPKIEVENSINGTNIKIFPEINKEYPFTLQKLQHTLKKNEVVYGIDQQALVNLLEKPSDAKILIACGKKPKPGVDESINVLIDTKKDLRPQILPDGRVDFKQKRIASVDMGEVLAIKIPGQPGESGIGVDGKTIAAPEYNKIELNADSGTMLQQNGFAVIALESGLPSMSITKNVWTFQVIPLLEYDEVNLSTGNVEFNGNLKINKDVVEGMSVLGTGNVDIGGSVYGAKVIALGSLSISKNVLSSFINAGDMSEHREILKTKLQLLNKDLNKLYQILLALKQRCHELNTAYCSGQMIARLINKKFSYLPKTVDELDKLLKQKKIIVSSNVKNLVNELVVKFRRLGWQKTKDIAEVQRLQQRIAATITSLDALDDNQGDVLISYAINSTIEASGDVRISGKGCINTQINTKGDVIIDGIFRGGAINCHGSVKINEAGSEIGTKTVIKTTGKSIQINKAHSNVKLTVGLNTKTINSTEYKVYLKNEHN